MAAGATLIARIWTIPTPSQRMAIWPMDENGMVIGGGAAIRG